MKSVIPFSSSCEPEVLAEIMILFAEGPFITTDLYPLRMKLSPSDLASVTTSERLNLL